MRVETTSDNRLVTTCHYNQGGGVRCDGGQLWQQYFPMREDGCLSEPIELEDRPLQCPACEGKGVIPTEHGREMIQFLQTYAYPIIRGMVWEIMEEQGC